jgi:hypothetical protein
LKELPGVAFHSVMTPIEQDAVPIAGGVGEGGVVNGSIPFTSACLTASGRADRRHAAQ